MSNKRADVKLQTLYPLVHPRIDVTSAHKYLNDDLTVSLCAIENEAWQPVCNHELSSLGLNFKQAYECALINLDRISRDEYSEQTPGVWVSPWGDNLDFSRMLLLNQLRKLPITGDPVVFLPRKDLLLVTGSQDIQGLGNALYATFSELTNEDSFGGTGFPFVLKDNHWHRFELTEPDHPCFETLYELTILTEFRNYEKQHHLLSQYCEEKALPVHISPYQVAKEEGKTTSFCTVTREVDALIPEATNMYFTTLNADTNELCIKGVVPWEEGLDLLGDMASRQKGNYPIRYLVNGSEISKFDQCIRQLEQR